MARRKSMEWTDPLELPPALQQQVDDYRARHREQIPASWRLDKLPAPTEDYVLDYARSSGLLTQSELAITELDDVDELLSRLATGQLSAVAVVTAFCKRTALAHQLLNCCTELLFDDAIARAKELDAYFDKHKKPIGPLHGLPISLKDQFDIKGVEQTMGYASWIGRISEHDAVAVKLLRDAGAVIHCRTNLPQTIMAGAADNWVVGRTVNAFRRSCSPGGSSGGEAALLASKGSPLGFGTDIAGSVRIPSTVHGLYALRPTARRLPYGGLSNSLLGIDSIESVIGPMSRSLSGCIAATRVLLQGQPWRYDPATVPVPWRDDQLSLPSKLCFGVIGNDGLVRPQPPIQRALHHTVDALRDAGHEVQEWDGSDLADMSMLAFRIYAADGGGDYALAVGDSGEPHHPILQGAPYARPATELTVSELWQANRQRDAIRKEWLDRWQATAKTTSTGRPLDAWIMPVLAIVGKQHDKGRLATYTPSFNVLDRPVVTFPVFDSLDAEKDKRRGADYVPLSEADSAIQVDYDPEVLSGLPIGLSVIGHRFEEEQLLAVTGVISEALRRRHIE